MASHSIKSLSILALAFMVSACSTTPSKTDYQSEINYEQKQISAWSYTQNQLAESALFLNDLLSSDELDSLLQQAYQHNPSLQQTLLTLQIRNSQLKEANAARLPDIDADVNATRTKDKKTAYSGSVSLDWQLGLWGQITNSIRAADYDLQQQSLLYKLAKDSLTAEVMNAWINLTALHNAITIQAELIDTLQQNETAILNRYRNGLGTLEDLDAARSSLASAKATLVSYEFNLRQQQRDMKSLVGNNNLALPSTDADYPSVGLALAGLPDQDLAARADLQAAFHAINAAEQRTDIAYKSLLPSFNIGASLSQAGTSPSDALLTSPIWSLLGQLSAPLFRAGELRSQAEQAELATAQAYQAYRETLMMAVNEVETALDRERNLTQQLTHTQQALNSQVNNLAQYQQRYRRGLVDILDVLSTQQQTFNLRAQINDLTYQRLINRINLGLALGLGAKQ